MAVAVGIGGILRVVNMYTGTAHTRDLKRSVISAISAP